MYYSQNNTVSTGKELDPETGYSYFGARYLDHTPLTLWLSVDPMADKYPSISPYTYCAWNPLKLVDPDGRDTINLYLDNGSIDLIRADGDHSICYIKDGKIVDSDHVYKDQCSFRKTTDDFPQSDGDESMNEHTDYLQCNDIDTGERIFKKIAKLGSSVEWDYYSLITGYGELSTSGIKDKMIHWKNRYVKKDVTYWNHYHPNNGYYSYYPSYADQDNVKDLGGARSTIFCDGRSLEFNKYVSTHKYGYIKQSEFTRLWNIFSK